MAGESFASDALRREVVIHRLKRLQNKRICTNVLEEKFRSLGREADREFLEQRGIEMAISIESAIGFLSDSSQGINSRILNRYYFLLQLTIAEQLSDPNNSFSLPEIQDFTKKGHGLKTVFSDTAVDMLTEFNCFITATGYFSKYLSFLRLDPNCQVNGSFDSNKHKTENLLDIIRTIPELGPLVEEYYGVFPRAFKVNQERISRHMVENPPAGRYLRVPKKFLFEKDDFQEYSLLPEKELKEEIWLQYNFYMMPDLSHAEINARLNIYESIFCKGVYLRPLFNSIQDHICIHFILLYCLSIIVRYYPKLWGEILRGNNEELKGLLDYYIFTFDEVVPLSMLQRISGKRYTYVAGNGSLQS